MATLDAVLGRAVDGAGWLSESSGRPVSVRADCSRDRRRWPSHLALLMFSTFCESHSRDIAFHAAMDYCGCCSTLTGRIRHRTERVRSPAPRAGPEDLRLLDDLLGIGEPPRRCRISTRMLAAVALTGTGQYGRNGARPTPTLYLIEDAHWIDST